MEQAVCVKCGAVREDYRAICPRCGHQPIEEGLLVAWLLSSQYLSQHKLEVVRNKIEAGEVVRPSDRMIDDARRALGRHYSSDPGMTYRQRLCVLATTLLLTPLVGWTLWFWWREERPRMALEALGLSAPATVLFFACGMARYLVG